MKSIIFSFALLFSVTAFSQRFNQEYIPRKNDYLVWYKKDGMYFQKNTQTGKNQWVFYISPTTGDHIYAYQTDINEIDIYNSMRFAYNNFPNGFYNEDTYMPSYYSKTNAEDIYTCMVLNKGTIFYVYKDKENQMMFGWFVNSETNVLMVSYIK